MIFLVILSTLLCVSLQLNNIKGSRKKLFSFRSTDSISEVDIGIKENSIVLAYGYINNDS